MLLQRHNPSNIARDRTAFLPIPGNINSSDRESYFAGLMTNQYRLTLLSVLRTGELKRVQEAKRSREGEKERKHACAVG